MPERGYMWGLLLCKGRAWGWNGSVDSPTITPSVKSTYPTKEKEYICHFFVKEGIAQFCNDCTHENAGKHIPVPEWDEEKSRYY